MILAGLHQFLVFFYCFYVILQISRSGYKLLLHWLCRKRQLVSNTDTLNHYLWLNLDLIITLGFNLMFDILKVLTWHTSFDTDYGKSFPDIVQGLEHVVENLGSDPISAPSSFKYRIALEKQVILQFLHLSNKYLLPNPCQLY